VLLAARPRYLVQVEQEVSRCDFVLLTVAVQIQYPTDLACPIHFQRLHAMDEILRSAHSLAVDLPRSTTRSSSGVEYGLGARAGLMTVDAGPSLLLRYKCHTPHTHHLSSVRTLTLETRGVSQPNATTTMRGRRCLLVHVLCFPAGHCFQTHQIVKGSILSPRHLEGPTKESFSSAPRTDITTSASFLASPRTTVASASSDSGSTMVDQGVSLIGKTTSMLVAGTFFSVLAWKRDTLMGEW
jgi:hypothetical protein